MRCTVRAITVESCDVFAQAAHSVWTAALEDAEELL